MNMLQTEYEFELPKGYVDPESGVLQKKGMMRLATAADEILPMRDPRVQQNPGYLSVILLSRVVTRLGNLENISSRIIESLFAADFTYLQEMYNRINGGEGSTVETECPRCSHKFPMEVNSPGGV